jgi:23S rRNA (guanosine2251-2'-O)-methyltransferase
MINNKSHIYGKHALLEVLTHRSEVIEKIWLAPDFSDSQINNLIEKLKIKTIPMQAGALPREVAETAVHQGIVAQITVSKMTVPFADFFRELKINKDTCLVLLDEIQDPHNVGAIIRSAAAFGIAGVLIPPHNQASVTGTVVKVSAGMAFSIPLVEIGNINNTLRDLKDKGFWVYGLDEDAETSITDEDFSAPTVLVLGSEGRGIREKTKELCDIKLAIPMSPRCESLNVSVSAGIALQNWSAKHPEALI